MKRTPLKHFGHDQSGSILILVGLSLIVLFVTAGAGYDLGRQRLVRQKIQQASDAAALAGAGMLLGSTNAERQTTALRYFALNYPASYLGVARPTPTIAFGANDIQVSANAVVPTSFVGNVGINSINAAGASVVQIKKTFNKIDAILVMDNSGSMATKDVGAGNSQNAGPGYFAACVASWTSYLMAAPYYYSASSASSYANSLYCPASNNGATGATRINALRYSATTLTDKLMNPNPNDNHVAYITWDNLVINTLNFTNDAATGDNFLSNIFTRNNTNSTVGLTQAQTFGAAGFRSGAVHAVVLLTDGANNPNQLSTNASSLVICNSLKTSGVLIYTIGFGAELSNPSASSAVARQFLSDCATGPNGPTKPNLNTYYFVAPNAATLKAAMDSIAGNLQAVRILQ